MMRPILGTTYHPTLGEPRKVIDIMHEPDGSCIIYYIVRGREEKATNKEWFAWIDEMKAAPTHAEFLAANRGREDYHDGKGFERCPYLKGNPLRIIWQDAWSTASEQALKRAA